MLENAVHYISSTEEDYLFYVELAQSLKDESDCEEKIEIGKWQDSTIAELERKKIESMFSTDADSGDCFLDIHSGAGGTESNDWTSILLRMYLRWCEDNNYKVEIVSELSGEEAGIKYATLKVCGKNAYGWLKNETGVHRLVRISPFNSAGKRHTSFASAYAYPIIDNNIEVKIENADIRIDTYRSSGAGGQHVNTTDSAVRITHLVTGIVVQSQGSRSQHKNKEECMSMLRSKLYELEQKKQREEIEKSSSTKTDIGWGNQIRSYVLHPYRMVKDVRTGYQENNTDYVLDGGITEFMKHNILKNIEGGGLKALQNTPNSK